MSFFYRCCTAGAENLYLFVIYCDVFKKIDMAYSERMMKLILSLREVRHTLFDGLINLAIPLEYGDVLDSFDEDEIFYFELDHFRSMDNFNVVSMVELIDSIEQKINLLMNLNNISDEDVEEAEYLLALEEGFDLEDFDLDDDDDFDYDDDDDIANLFKGDDE